MNLIKKDIKNILYRSNNLILLYIFMLIVTQIYILRFHEYNPIEVFFEAVVPDGGIISSFEEFVPPIFWFIYQLLPTFIVSLSIYTDHIENSNYDILRTKSRNKYFFSKIIAAFLVIIILNSFLMVFVLINEIHSYNHYLTINFIRLVISYIFVQFLLFYISFVIGLKFGYKYAITSVFIQLVLSMATNFKFIIGQQSLVFKQDFMNGYLTFKENLIVFFMYTLTLSIVSYFVFKNYDFCGGSID